MKYYGMVIGLLLVGFYVGIKKPNLLVSVPVVGSILSP